MPRPIDNLVCYRDIESVSARQLPMHLSASGGRQQKRRRRGASVLLSECQSHMKLIYIKIRDGIISDYYDVDLNSNSPE